MTTGDVRIAERRQGWAWLALAVMSPAFLVGAHAEFLSRPQRFLLAVAFGAAGLALWIVEAHSGDLGPEARRIEGRRTLAYIALMVLVAAIAIVWNPTGPPGWFVAAALLPAVPCAEGAWRGLR
ncbi:MAG: hypothetical protein WD734_00420 [Dehalococcoidia bacterium]